MYNTDFWHKHNLYGKKIILFLFCCISLHSLAQRNVLENDIKFARRPYHFGIHLAANMGDYKINHSALFAVSDSVLAITNKLGVGFEIGALFSYHINKYLELRTVPSFSFTSKNLEFTFSDESKKKKDIPQIYFDFPIEIKFKSQPLRDIKVYAIGGLKYGYDIGGNINDRKKTGMPHQKLNDFGVVYGVGLEIHFPLFILSPEIKAFNSVLNIHKQDQEIFAPYIKGLYNRTFTFSINFEG
ncbi:MAG TPA: outer membrane beta-barrel protein [Chitinophagales bacterium]|nr:outer membrane beta-barrel protein [Chitinophagales bacterium]